MSQGLLQQAMQMHQAGRIAEAANIYQQVLRSDPQNYVALYSLGFACAQSGQFENAERLFGAAIIVGPREFDPWHHRGSSLYRLNRHPEALACFDRALSLDPSHVETLTNRAVVLMEMGMPERALTTVETALAFRPDFIPALVNRGNALSALQRHEEAIAAYDAALAISPGMQEVIDNRENALFQLGRASRCPPGYMRRLFDDFSGDYDTRMVDTLGYRAHLHLRTLFDRLRPEAKAPLRILDLGCGTGLVGEAFKDLAQGGRLDGVDLAPQMIDAARRRGIYSELFLNDLESHLAVPGLAYDLILAADTMIYLGDLHPTFSGVAEHLAPEGLYVFAVETKDGAGWEQTPANRFRHSLDYLRTEAERARLEFVDYIDCELRSEASVPVPGYTVALHKPR